VIERQWHGGVARVWHSQDRSGEGASRCEASAAGPMPVACVAYVAIRGSSRSPDNCPVVVIFGNTARVPCNRRLDMSMLASRYFYDSGTFWGATAAIAAVVAIIVPLVVWRMGAPRRLLTYGMPVTTPMLSSHLPGLPAERLQVTLDGQPLANPHVAVLRIENKSRRDIRSSDFDQSKPLEFDLGAKVAAVPVDPARFPETLKVDGAKITIGPMLIRGNSRLELSLVTDGRPNLACQSYLVNVNMRLQDDEKQRKRYIIIDMASTLCLISSLITVVILESVKTNLPTTEGVITFFIPVVVISWIISMWSNRKWKRS
jgi:hypothetical protein